MSILLTLGALGAFMAPQDGAVRQPDLLVRAARIVIAPDTVLTDGAILVRDGKVAYVGREIPDEAARAARRVEFGKRTVVPGFVNPHSHLGQGADLAENIVASTPDLKAADAFNPFDEALLESARHGVTSIGLAPLSANVMAGIAAVVKTGEIGTVRADSSYLKVALVQESLDQNRFPTSHMGALELLRGSFQAARGSVTAPYKAESTLRDVLAGSLRLAIHARTHGEISQALDLAQDVGVAPLLIGAVEVERHIPRIARQRGSVVLGPLSITDTQRKMSVPAKLERAGIPFSFMTTMRGSTTQPSQQGPPRIRGLPPGMFMMGRGSRSSRPAVPVEAPAEQLRLSVALAVHHGLSRRTALAALTRVPAEQCGVASACGSLRQGCDADFLVFDGDPTDLSARLHAVYISGAPLEAAATEESKR